MLFTNLVVIKVMCWCNLRQPVPNSTSTISSPIIGISLSIIGNIIFLPIKLLYLVSDGLTQTAESPKNVSGLVVATMILSTESLTPYSR